MLDQDTRRKLMLQQEGQVLASAGSYGVPTACESARCLVDGITNALIRMEGAEETANFMFAVSDRVAGGLRENTDYVSTILKEVVVDRAFKEIRDKQAEQALARALSIRLFAFGFLVGCAVMMAVTILAQGRV